MEVITPKIFSALNVPWYVGRLRDTGYFVSRNWNGTVGDEFVSIAPMDFLNPHISFILAHEAAHVAGIEHRLNRRSIRAYHMFQRRHTKDLNDPRLWNSTSLRIEEAVADQTATLLTGMSTAQFRVTHDAYPPVRSPLLHRYVESKANEAANYIRLKLERYHANRSN